jgi:hypothetical protein
MPHPSIVRHRTDELLEMRASGMTLCEIANKFGVHEGSIRKTIGLTGRIREGKARPIFTRFWEKVDRRGLDECWEWIGAISTSGYGHIFWEGKIIDAHRVSYVLAYGEIPENMMILHNCNNKLCVNPNHLRTGTQSDNMADLAKARKEGAPSVSIRKI